MRRGPMGTTSSQLGRDLPACGKHVNCINNTSNLSRENLGRKMSSNEFPNADFLPPLTSQAELVAKGNFNNFAQAAQSLSS